MPRHKITLENDRGLSIMAMENGKPLLTLSTMDWEADFFGRKFGKLKIEREAGDDFDLHVYRKALKALLSGADRHRFDLIELSLDISWFDRAFFFEDSGFRLVDIKLTFINLVRKSEIEDVPPGLGEISFAAEEMKDEIIGLTHRSFTDNPLFKSRFNNRRYFSRLDAQRYYSAWIENHISDKSNFFAVMMYEGKPVGYMIYRKKGEYKGKTLYKGVLVAVAPEHRGKKIHLALQSFVYRCFPESEVFLEITTQLTNLSAIKNYIKSHTTLDHVEVIFYRLKGEAR